MVSTSFSATVIAPIMYPEAPPKGVRPFQSATPDPITGQTMNFEKVPQNMDIENVRGKEDTFNLDNAGFLFHKSPASHTSFADDEIIRKEYYPESVELFKKLTGASRVFIFDHAVRRNSPVNQAHVDQSLEAAPARVHRHLPEDADALLKKRFQIVNLWRPIGCPAWAWPLGLCDYRSVNPNEDVFPVKLIFPDREGESFAVTYNPEHKWKYLRGMTPEEIILVKCFDSVQDGSVAVFTPHTAFPDPTTPADAPPRESIEVRALVFYD